MARSRAQVSVKPIQRGYDAYELTNVGGALYFTIPYDDARGNELWILGTARSVLDNDVVRAPLPATATVAKPPSHGTLAFNPDETFMYRPHAGFSGDDSFTYRLTDGTVVSNTATVTIHVAAAPPVISSSDATVTEGTGADTVLTFTVTRRGDLSAPGAALSATNGAATVDTIGAVGHGQLRPRRGDAAGSDPGARRLDRRTRRGPVPQFQQSRRRDPGAHPRLWHHLVGDDFHADLAVTVTVAPDPALLGESLSYQVVIANHGPRDATGVSLTMPVSASHVSSVSATSPAGPCIVPLLFLVHLRERRMRCRRDCGGWPGDFDGGGDSETRPTPRGFHRRGRSDRSRVRQQRCDRIDAGCGVGAADRGPDDTVKCRARRASLGIGLRVGSFAGGGQIVRYRWTLVERNLFVETSVPTVTFLLPRGNATRCWRLPCRTGRLWTTAEMSPRPCVRSGKSLNSSPRTMTSSVFSGNDTRFDGPCSRRVLLPARLERSLDQCKRRPLLHRRLETIEAH